jgi:hypothetical protein
MTPPPAAGRPRIPRRLGWAALAAAVAATTTVVPPLVLPAPPESSSARARRPPSPTAPTTPGSPVAPTAPGSPSAPAAPGFTPIGVHAADGANLRKGARIIDCPSCDGGRRVGYIGGPNTLAVRVAGVPSAGERTLLIVYETQDPRTLMVAVDAGPVHTLPLAGAADYAIPARTAITVYLPAGTCWIRFFNDAGPAPDINRIELR